MNQPYDSNSDGIADTWLSDTNGDGRADTGTFDVNQDGIADGTALDLDGDGHFETVGLDPDQNGVYEAIQAGGILFTDTDGDGAADSGLAGSTASIVGGTGGADYTIDGDPYVPSGIVGGAPSYDGVGGLVIDIASDTGSATFGTPDSDGDGYHDGIDHRPFDDDYF